MAPALSSTLSPAELSYLHTSLSSHPPIRPDSRSSTSFRPLQAETGILPATNGSAHLSFSDGSECIVGVKLEVERTPPPSTQLPTAVSDRMDLDQTHPRPDSPGPSSPSWISLSMNPTTGMRDDDPSLIYLESMLLEPLTQTTLPSQLIINTRWHWHIYIDVLLISSQGLASYPLPLLSMATHLALRDTRVPRLKSEGEEDPVADDDWMASGYLYSRGRKGRSRGGIEDEDEEGKEPKPPVTLLVVTVNDNIIFDPSHEELKVADTILAISVACVRAGVSTAYTMLSMRLIDTPARDTMKGVRRDGEIQEGREVPGVWKPRVGGIKRQVVKDVVKTVLSGGVAADVMDGLQGFLRAEEDADGKARAG